VGAGAFSAVAALWLMTASDEGFQHGRWLAFTALVFAQSVRAYANRSLDLPVTSLRRNGFLLAACLVTVALQVLIPFVPPLAEAFRASPLGPSEWVLVMGIAFVPAVVAEAVRRAGRGPWVA
jgi:magnesium-transporting ATPase (P-type)